MSNGKGTGGKAGSGGGGAAPDAEGNVDKIKAVREEEFFHKQRGEQLKKLKTKKESPKQKNEQKKK